MLLRLILGTQQQDNAVNRLMVQRGVLAGLWMSALGLALYAWMLDSGRPLDEARNALLLLMVLMQNVDAFNARSETRSVFRIPLRNNPLLAIGVAVALLLHVSAMHTPFLQRVLELAPLGNVERTVLPLLAISLLLVMELHKLSWKWRRGT